MLQQAVDEQLEVRASRGQRAQTSFCTPGHIATQVIIGVVTGREPFERAKYAVTARRNWREATQPRGPIAGRLGLARDRRAGPGAQAHSGNQGVPADDRSEPEGIEGRLIQIGLRVLELGSNVVIDYGLWSRDERSALRQAAADLGARAELRYFELTPAEQRRRLDQRQAETPHTTWPMSDEELAGWAASIDIPTPGELDGSEPVDDPPAGFATWDEWRRHRWPPSVS